MWVGNVPSDASHDELWRFFTQPLEGTAARGSSGGDAEDNPGAVSPTTATMGVLSIFLISRSSCAFVNIESEVRLQEAIARFNGKPLRTADPRCPRLVCRVRRKDDDLKAGVGGQRGMGMHARWVKDRKGKGRDMGDVSDVSASDDPPTSPSNTSDHHLTTGMSSLSLSSDEEGKMQHHSSSSGSFASTNSSVLARYFPKRYFILKSLTQVSEGSFSFTAFGHVIYLPIVHSMTWILAWRGVCGRRRSTTKGFWTRRIGLARTCT